MGLTLLSIRFREAGDVRKKRQFLPADKQYLVTRNGEPQRALHSLS